MQTLFPILLEAFQCALQQRNNKQVMLTRQHKGEWQCRFQGDLGYDFDSHNRSDEQSPWREDGRERMIIIICEGIPVVTYLGHVIKKVGV